MNKSGIYKIQSIVKSERCYIGSAVNVQKRWWVHLCELRKNKHGSLKLQRHYNKYGEVDLQFSVLLGCEKEDLIKTEQYFLDSYNPWFNNCRIAGSQLGMKYEYKKRKPCSEETKEKLRKFNLGKPSPNKGKHPSEATIINMRKSHSGHIAWNKGLHTGIIPPNVFKKGNIPMAPFRKGNVAINPFKKGNIAWNKGLKGLKRNRLKKVV